MLIRTSLKAGDLGSLIRLHGILYAQEYNLDHTFEAYVAAALGSFACSDDEAKGRLWIAEIDERIVGSIAIARLPEQVAQLRWFLVHPEMRGKGLGHRLMSEALEYCREVGVRSVFLWTLSDLKTAAHLYRKAGFRLSEHKTHEVWGAVRTEERYDLTV